MKLLLLILCLAASGCTAVFVPTGKPYLLVATGYSVVNNTGVALDVVQDGRAIYTNLFTGQVLALKSPLWRHKSVVTVLGHDLQGNYIGTATWAFISEASEAWEVTRLNSPKPPY